MSLKTTKQGNTTCFSIKPDNISWGVVAFVSLIFSVFIIGFIHIMTQIIIGEIHFVAILFFAFFFWAAYYNFFNFYYMLIGNEIIEIQDSYIKRTREVWKIRHSKKYFKLKINSIAISDSSNQFGAMGLEMFGLSTINVTFKYGKKKQIFGKQINMDEAKIIYSELAIRKYATQHAGIKHGAGCSS
nr:hypothetical protein [uncultured Carboxylicivirga sp.]